MSLVELALKKMQSAARAGEAVPAARTTQPHPETPARASPGVIGQVVNRGDTHFPVDANDSAREPGKIVRIDQAALRAAGLIPPEQQARMLADQYRNIKRPLVSAAIGRGVPKIPGGQLIMMASAMPGEGKTFTSINLALSMALEKDVSVLLLDADVAKPHISRIFGVEQEPGLIDVLRDERRNVESVILPTDVPNLSILPAGQRSDTATELLASHRMEGTMNYLAASNPQRIVLIDSPPLLLTSESRALAHWVGQIVVVVRADQTPRRAVLDSIEQLGTDKSISLVLNQSKDVTPGYYHGYGTPPVMGSL
jgi:receptor protein-tyrosine kinase